MGYYQFFNLLRRKQRFKLFWIVENIGKVLDILKKDESTTTQTDDAEQLCASISPIDKYNAEKPGTDYETEIGDDCKWIEKKCYVISFDILYDIIL